MTDDPIADVMDRIWNQTETIPECGCYVWLGALTSKGYGHVRVGGIVRRVHRVAYEQLVGPVPDGLMLDHLCRVRACWRPDHLEPVTNRENILRGTNFSAVNARKTHCHKGHPLSGDNLIIKRGGAERACRECELLWRYSTERRAYNRELMRRSRAALKEQAGPL